MTKISVETYINAVECYLTGKDSKRRVGKRYGIEDRAFRVLVAIYEQHGREGLIASPRITGEFRVNLVEWKQGHKVLVQSLLRESASCGFKSSFETVNLFDFFVASV